MKRVKSYLEYLKENIALDQLGTSTEVTHKKNDGTTETKPIHRIDHQNELIYFLDKAGKEFAKGIDDIVSVG